LAEYRVRRTLFEKESVLTVENAALVRTAGPGVRQEIALRDVHGISLIYRPVGLIDRWVCSVRGPHGRIWLPSASFFGLGRTRDQRDAFRGFVEALHLAIEAEPSAAQVAFVQGDNWSAYSSLGLLIVSGVMAMLLLLAVVGAMADGRGLRSVSWVFLAALAIFWGARMVWPIWRRNRRQIYTPDAIPPTFAQRV